MKTRSLLGKVIIKGIIQVTSGLHIGSSRESLEIGGLDAPVLRDPLTSEPYIPGSSIKGKLRALLERAYAAKSGKGEGFFNRNIGRPNYPIKVHVCNDAEQATSCPVCRLFGSSGTEEGRNFPARIKFRDCHLTRYSERELRERDTELLYTELKYENALDRITAAANPRQIERVPAGTEFAFEIVYDVEDPLELKEDLENLTIAVGLLQDDYLGGHGSRGYGKVKICLSQVQAKKIDAYKGVETAKIDVISGPDISRETNEKPQASELKPFLEVLKHLERVEAFFKS